MARDELAPGSPEVVLDVEVRTGAVVLVLANTGSSTAFEPRVAFEPELVGLQGEVVVSDLPVWTRLAMLRPGCQVDVLLDAQSARGTAEHRRFTATLTYRDSSGREYKNAYTHDLAAYDGLPTQLS